MNEEEKVKAISEMLESLYKLAKDEDPLSCLLLGVYFACVSHPPLMKSISKFTKGELIALKQSN